MNQNLREHVIATFLIDAMRLQRSDVGRELRVCATEYRRKQGTARRSAFVLANSCPACHVVGLAAVVHGVEHSIACSKPETGDENTTGHKKLEGLVLGVESKGKQ